MIQDYCKNPLNEGYQLQCDEFFQDTNEIIEENEKLYYTKYICVRDLKKLGYYSEEQSVLMTDGKLVKVGRFYVTEMKEVAKKITEHNKKRMIELSRNRYRVKMNTIL